MYDGYPGYRGSDVAVLFLVELLFRSGGLVYNVYKSCNKVGE